MKRRGIVLSALIVGVSLSGVIGLSAAHADDQTDIKALEQRYVTAVKAKDIKAIMACYMPDESLLVFDVYPPRQYVGAKAYQRIGKSCSLPTPERARWRSAISV